MKLCLVIVLTLVVLDFPPSYVSLGNDFQSSRNRNDRARGYGRHQVERIIFTKTGVGTALAGDTVAYTISFGNPDALVLTHTNIRDTLDPRMVFIDATNGGVFNNASNSISWNLGRVDSLAAFLFIVRVRTSDTIHSALNLVNHATLSASEILDIPVQAPTRILVPGKVKIWKNSNVHRASMGDTVSYAIHVKNLSDISATGVEVTDSLPNEINFLSADTIVALDSHSRIVTIGVGSLQPGQQRNYILKAILRSDLWPGQYNFTNIATATWHRQRSTSADDTSSHSTINTDVTEGVSELLNTARNYALAQNYPNPFNPSSIVIFELPNQSRVRLSVFNLLGQEVRTLVNAIEQPGETTVRFDATNMPSGIYLYRLDATSVADPTKHFSQTRKMLLVR